LRYTRRSARHFFFPRTRRCQEDLRVSRHQNSVLATAYRGRIEHAHDISFPLIVKPSWEDGSIGIDAGSVVKNIKEMMERIEYIQDEFDSRPD